MLTNDTIPSAVLDYSFQHIHLLTKETSHYNEIIPNLDLLALHRAGEALNEGCSQQSTRSCIVQRCDLTVVLFYFTPFEKKCANSYMYRLSIKTLQFAKYIKREMNSQICRNLNKRKIFFSLSFEMVFHLFEL